MAQERYDALVGLDVVKQQVVAEATVLLDPSRLDKWGKKHHGTDLRVVDEVKQRTPLLVFAGDVGTGKTELAETFGASVSRSMSVGVSLFSLSLAARGSGAVGEMTTLLTRAFEEVASVASKALDDKRRIRHGVILLVDEADALAQSRELVHMHHEDRAGVNALVRGVDNLRRDLRPVLTVLCTNRVEALDPAVLRRAAGVHVFNRPNDVQRRKLLANLLEGINPSEKELDSLVTLAGATSDRSYGCTYSDIRQRLVPQAVLDAVSRDVPLTGTLVIQHAEKLIPTRPFGMNNDGG